MSALARYFSAQGNRVLGYDRTPSRMTQQLEAEGIAVQYDDSLEGVKRLDKDNTMVVHTPAVPQDATLYRWFAEHGFRIKKRAELLGCRLAYWLCNK